MFPVFYNKNEVGLLISAVFGSWITGWKGNDNERESEELFTALFPFNFCFPSLNPSANL